MSQQLSSILRDFLTVVVVPLIPVAFDYLYAQAKTVKQKAFISNLEKFAEMAVHEVEPAATDKKPLSNTDRKNTAMEIVTHALGKKGLKADPELISGAIETAADKMHQEHSQSGVIETPVSPMQTAPAADQVKVYKPMTKTAVAPAVSAPQSAPEDTAKHLHFGGDESDQNAGN
ncbi:phage holin, LLH family [Lacticaseibacillus zhaodongensis]|uniref:phage holin, LLH family n=1 Tax=Lacticaseibacillus zhaodongensis TaxID=2668065 RepID=UPI0012D2B60B|nr:phage holin, LLH family [Lacticaseibacillus zhaodongensis]